VPPELRHEWSQNQPRFAGRTIEIAKAVSMTAHDVALALRDVLPMLPEEAARQLEAIIGAPDLSELRCDFQATTNAQNGAEVWVDMGVPTLVFDLMNHVVDNVTSHEAKTYVGSHPLSKRAKDLLGVLRMRRLILQRVGVAIANCQAEYLSGARNSPRPLLRLDVSELCGLSISMVSRAAKGKSMKAHRGIVALESLFSLPVATLDGGAVSRTEALSIMEEIVNGDPARRMSDEELKSELLKRGIALARRTIAKYRRDLGIGRSRVSPVASPLPADLGQQVACFLKGMKATVAAHHARAIKAVVQLLGVTRPEEVTGTVYQLTDVENRLTTDGYKASTAQAYAKSFVLFAEHARNLSLAQSARDRAKEVPTPMSKKTDQAPQRLVIEIRTENGEPWGTVVASAREFSTGSVGFLASGSVRNPTTGAWYQVTSNVVLIGSKHRTGAEKL
jgi:hypothetical protein